VYTFPGRQSDTDDFFMTNLMMDYSQTVALEGDCPLGYVDLSVFVAPVQVRHLRLLRLVQQQVESISNVLVIEWGGMRIVPERR
jgi:hypothetical protein